MIKPKVKKQAFWTEELSTKRITLRTLYRQYRQLLDAPEWEAYITARQYFKHTLRKKKEILEDIHRGTQRSKRVIQTN